MEEVKALLTVIIENQQVTNAKLDAIETRLSKLEKSISPYLASYRFNRSLIVGSATTFGAALR